MITEAQRQQRAMGPVDYLVVRFPGNRLTGKIAPELRRLEDSGIVRVIDLVFIRKDEQGDVETLEIADLGGELGNAFQTFKGTVGEWLSQGDIEVISDELPHNSSAGAILFENLWAARLREAVLESGGEMVSYGRIPSELIEATREKAGPAGPG